MSVQCIQPTASQLKFILLNPPHCFCNKPAHRSYTLEYGPILECAGYGVTKRDNYEVKFVCGFHVHELSWISFIQDIKEGSFITSHYSELRACPLYNFTYQALFCLANDFNRITPSILPNCFCKNSVKLCDEYPLYFSCQNRYKAGTKKCVWYLEAKEVAFIKSKLSLHSYVSLEKYERNYLIKKSIIQNTWSLQEQEITNNQPYFNNQSTALQIKNNVNFIISEAKYDLLSMMNEGIRTGEKLARIKVELEKRTRQKKI